MLRSTVQRAEAGNVGPDPEAMLRNALFLVGANWRDRLASREMLVKLLALLHR
jgi:hypothetical protein